MIVQLVLGNFKQTRGFCKKSSVELLRFYYHYIITLIYSLTYELFGIQRSSLFYLLGNGRGK